MCNRTTSTKFIAPSTLLTELCAVGSQTRTEDTSCRDLQRGQGEAESRALAWSAGHRDPPAVQLNQQAGDYEPQPRAAAHLKRAIVGPEECGKELRLSLGGEANAGVADVHAHEPLVSPSCHRDAAVHQRVLVGVGGGVRED